MLKQIAAFIKSRQGYGNILSLTYLAKIDILLGENAICLHDSKLSPEQKIYHEYISEYSYFYKGIIIFLRE